MNGHLNPSIPSKYFRILMNAYKITVRDLHTHLPLSYNYVTELIRFNGKPLDERFIKALISAVDEIKNIDLGDDVQDLIKKAIQFEKQGVSSILQRNYQKREKFVKSK